MKFVNPLPFVTDMKRAEDFYADVLGLKVVQDHGDFVQFENGFALHEGASPHKTTGRLDLIHPAGRQEWGQRVFRFRDPDGHIVEAGEAQ